MMEQENTIEQERKYQQLVVQGWTGMLFLLLTMFITDIVLAVINNDYESFSQQFTGDPGIAGMYLLVAMICINVMVQMVVRVINKPYCIFIVFVLTVLYTLFFLIHQVVHLMGGEGMSIHFVMDITHHVLGFWAAYCAYKWAGLSKNRNSSI